MAAEKGSTVSITEIERAVASVATSCNVARTRVEVAYHEDGESDMPWIVRITYRMARSGAQNAIQGYGATPADASFDAFEAYRRAARRGDIKDVAAAPPCNR